MRKIKNNYQLLISCGAILWILGFTLGGLGLYPWMHIGYYPGPALVVVGIIGWIVSYKEKNSHFPNLFVSIAKSYKKYKGIFVFHMTAFDFLFSHVLHFWTFCILFWAFTCYMANTVMTKTSTYAHATQFIEQNDSLKSELGGIRYYGIFVTGNAKGDGSGK